MLSRMRSAVVAASILFVPTAVSGITFGEWAASQGYGPGAVILDTFEAFDVEGVLYMTRSDFDAFDTAGSGLLSLWHSENGHHVAFVPESETRLLIAVSSLFVLVALQVTVRRNPLYLLRGRRAHHVQFRYPS